MKMCNECAARAALLARLNATIDNAVTENTAADIISEVLIPQINMGLIELPEDQAASMFDYIIKRLNESRRLQRHYKNHKPDGLRVVGPPYQR
jgi:hypothetical protein